MCVCVCVCVCACACVRELQWESDSWVTALPCGDCDARRPDPAICALAQCACEAPSAGLARPRGLSARGLSLGRPLTGHSAREGSWRPLHPLPAPVGPRGPVPCTGFFRVSVPRGCQTVRVHGGSGPMEGQGPRRVRAHRQGPRRVRAHPGSGLGAGFLRSTGNYSVSIYLLSPLLFF